MSNPRQTTAYFPLEVIEELQREAERQDRSLSWLMQRAWKIARAEIRTAPDAPVRVNGQS